VGDCRFGAVTGRDGGTGQKICPYQKCTVYSHVHGHKYSDSGNLFRIFCGELMKTEENEIFADKRSRFKKLIMVSYFGWVYVALLTLFTVSGSLAVGYLVNTLAKD
jgi:hypothetical protein